MGWHNRCCAPPPYIGHCDACLGDGSNVSPSVTLEFAGIADSVCSNGEAYNGTYVLPWSFGCHWAETFTPICPTDFGDTLTVDFWVTKLTGGNYVAYAQIRIYDASRAATGTYTFKLDSGQDVTAYDCENFSGLELPYDSKIVDFDWIDCTAATATATSSG